MEGNRKILIASSCGLLIGMAAGGAGAYVYSKRYFKAKYDADVQEMAEYYMNRCKNCDGMLKILGGEDDSSNKEESVDKESAIEAKMQTEYEAISDIYSNKEEQKAPTAYNEYFDAANSSSTSTKKKGGKKKKKVDIEAVDESVWDENPGGLETAFLVYYEADGTLINEETEEKLELEDICKAIDSNTATDGVMVLQDNVNKILYHVTVEQMAYSEVGLDD